MIHCSFYKLYKCIINADCKNFLPLLRSNHDLITNILTRVKRTTWLFIFCLIELQNRLREEPLWCCVPFGDLILVQHRVSVSRRIVLWIARARFPGLILCGAMQHRVSVSQCVMHCGTTALPRGLVGCCTNF